MDVNVGVFEPCTESMGPGKRACLWVRGCSLNCPGCGTPELIPRSPPTLRVIPPLPEGRVWEGREEGGLDTDSLIQKIREARDEHGIEGVSFSGGEPFEQAEALALIARACRGLGLSTLSWSGFTRKHLESPRAPKGSRQLLDELDVLIDGSFVRGLARGNLVLRGSSNQVIHRLTDRYTVADLASAKVTITVQRGGAQIVGIVPYELGEAMLLLL